MKQNPVRSGGITYQTAIRIFDSDIFEECTGIKVDYDCPDNKDSKTGSLKGISAF